MNPAGAAFCESCGKALPTTNTGPRVLGAGDMPVTRAGGALVGEELQKQMKRASIALLIVAILQTLMGPVLLMVEKTKQEKANPGMVYEVSPLGYAIVFGIAAIFWALFFWARKAPLPAAITGLVVFISLHLVDAVMDPTQLARGICMKIFVIVALVQAIQAALKYRQLQAGGGV